MAQEEWNSEESPAAESLEAPIVWVQLGGCLAVLLLLVISAVGGAFFAYFGARAAGMEEPGSGSWDLSPLVYPVFGSGISALGFLVLLCTLPAKGEAPRAHRATPAVMGAWGLGFLTGFMGYLINK